ncbi:5-formyltetrahydrofolate cyclo-ligase [Xylocopilactobacillus apicola]|uniref:5-formyltetrahydrofolate cyclo-ligase n=1 Tax=Xylocopilactobacillus apicola TaxID=2932184 RepID=A0AAU9D2J3_9LACO|nr:5-formyltetrahydrofolate cyclo-ligase [Xylocopilactobacillus apicola]BDR59001.1 5-formyltetrahydrofolate cyclo-ligase [Xylocopilactobacillus apicola]
MINKKEIRQIQISKLQNLPADERITQATQIFANFKNTKNFQQAKNIAMFWSTELELPTHEFINEIKTHKHVYLPVVAPQHQLIFRKFVSEATMQTNRGIDEPTPDSPTISPNDLDLIVVPGLIFSRTKYRIGFGGGYYDRFLAKYDNFSTALSFKEQFVSDPTWEIDSFDRPVKQLITPNAIY